MTDYSLTSSAASAVEDPGGTGGIWIRSLTVTSFIYMNLFSLFKYIIDSYLHKIIFFSISLNISFVKKLLKIFYFSFELITIVLHVEIFHWLEICSRVANLKIRKVKEGLLTLTSIAKMFLLSQSLNLTIFLIFKGNFKIF